MLFIVARIEGQRCDANQFVYAFIFLHFVDLELSLSSLFYFFISFLERDVAFIGFYGLPTSHFKDLVVFSSCWTCSWIFFERASTFWATIKSLSSLFIQLNIKSIILCSLIVVISIVKFLLVQIFYAWYLFMNIMQRL